MRFVVSLLAAAVSFGVVACASNHPTPPPATARAPRPEPLPPLDDAQIAQLVRDAARGEIEQASLAQTLARDPQVRAFAEHVVTDDRALTSDEMRTLARLRILPEASDASDTMEVGTRARVDQLRPEFGSGFDRTFIEAEIDHDRQVLSLIDYTLLRAVKSRPLRQTLLDARPIVAMHLQEAQRLREAMLTHP